ncbi:hypothetical protein GCM10022406_08090 [Hymenobacter algoricola]|uniref:Uncharacterized protein n=1 Tax=Hymenobacter algoricola TaxID=486267 RepID=A0ABP7MJA9_9BACT
MLEVLAQGAFDLLRELLGTAHQYVKTGFLQHRRYRGRVGRGGVVELRLAQRDFRWPIPRLLKKAAHGFDATGANHVFDVQERSFHGRFEDESSRAPGRAGFR